MDRSVFVSRLSVRYYSERPKSKHIGFSFQTVNLSFYVILSIILDIKTNKNSDKYIVCYCFSSKNPTQNNKFIVLCRFASIKLPRHDIPKNNCCLNDTIIFFVIVLCRFVLLVKKKCYRRPLLFNFLTTDSLSFLVKSLKSWFLKSFYPNSYANVYSISLSSGVRFAKFKILLS